MERKGTEEDAHLREKLAYIYLRESEKLAYLRARISPKREALQT